jgi:hypothetical protein
MLRVWQSGMLTVHVKSAHQVEMVLVVNMLNIEVINCVAREMHDCRDRRRRTECSHVFMRKRTRHCVHYEMVRRGAIMEDGGLTD